MPWKLIRPACGAEPMAYPLLEILSDVNFATAPGRKRRRWPSRKERVMSKIGSICDGRAGHGLAVVRGVANALTTAASLEQGLERLTELLARDPEWSGCQLLEPARDGALAAALQWRRGSDPDGGAVRVPHPVAPGPLAMRLAGSAIERSEPAWDRPRRCSGADRVQSPSPTTTAALPILTERGPMAALVIRWRMRTRPEGGLAAAAELIGPLLGRLVDRERRPKEIARARAAARREIARELHDDLGQQLAGLALLAQAMRRRAAAVAAGFDDEIAELVAGLGEAHASVRELAHGLALRRIEPDGLGRALHEMTRRSNTAHEVECTLQVDDTARVANAETATHLVRIAQEAFHNALAHGEPKRVAVGLGRFEGGLRLEVRDDGRGLPVQRRRDGLGLTSMRERAQEIGAELAVSSRRGAGTVVSCSLPGGVA
jgi:signal transduction histidine kinase